MYKLYVEDFMVLCELGSFRNPSDLECICSDIGLYFYQDNYGDCYVMRDLQCDEFMVIYFPY